jgi:hypothetical protein
VENLIRRHEYIIICPVDYLQTILNQIQHDIGLGFATLFLISSGQTVLPRQLLFAHGSDGNNYQEYHECSLHAMS